MFVLANVRQIYNYATSSPAAMPCWVIRAGSKTTNQVARSHIHIYIFQAVVRKSLRLRVIEPFLRISKLKKRLV